VILGAVGQIASASSSKMVRASDGLDASGDVVVAAAQILHKRMAEGQDPRRAMPLQAPDRPQPGLRPP
jgi:hypothetical protein